MKRMQAMLASCALIIAVGATAAPSGKQGVSFSKQGRGYSFEYSYPSVVNGFPALKSKFESERIAALAETPAVNAEIRDLFAAGADIVQIDEPYMQARPDKARAYGLRALNVALDGVVGTTAVHICFGYAAVIHARPSGY